VSNNAQFDILLLNGRSAVEPFTSLEEHNRAEITGNGGSRPNGRNVGEKRQHGAGATQLARM
jgi:hypothetical protein